MNSFTSPHIIQRGRAVPLRFSRLSCVPSRTTRADRSSAVGQESATMVDDCVVTFEKSVLGWHGTVPDDAALDTDSWKEAWLEDDFSSSGFVPLCSQPEYEKTSLKARMQTDSKLSRKLIKYMDLAETYFGMSVDTQRKLARAGNETRALEFEVGELHGQIDTLTGELAGAKALADDHKKGVSELESVLDLAMTAIGQLQKRNEELEASQVDSEHRLLGYEERLRESQTMLYSAVSQVEKLSSENEKVADQKAALYDALSKSLATSGPKQKALEMEIKELKTMREEAAEKAKVVDAAWDKKHTDAVCQFEQRLSFMRSERARFRIEAREHKHKAAFVEKQKEASEAALATCNANLQATSLELKNAQEDLTYAQNRVEEAQKRGEACERHIRYLESLLPIEGEGAKRLLSLGDKLEKAMAKSQHTRTRKLQDITNRRTSDLCATTLTPAPVRPSSKTTLPVCASSYVPGLQGTPYVPTPPASSFPTPDWTMSDASSLSFIKMHASNLIDVSEGEILFGSMGTTANPIDKSPIAPRAAPSRCQTGSVGLNKAPRVVGRRRL
ncbi:hypothetical protein EVJ58_g672 [Rhodofomes roseus]|uniref:Uncharacterized protein n=1 Tax=Rhodofomes roseus TaxID=34475 RepID=A0A4Y9Z347_9APHY|nr:hypothetical protein EVJ58_g672 [Rhodofomes roseus]